jgi:hypothetical protein
MKSLSFRIVLAFITLIASTAALSQELSIGSETISSGGVATVALDISGLGNGTALGTFDVNVGFNSSVVNFASATYGDPVLGDQLNLEGYGTISSTTPGIGTTELFELSLDSPSALTSRQAQSFTLATLTFDAVGTGTSALALSVNTLGDQNGNPLPATLRNGSITVGGSSITGAPEIDATSAAGALTLLLGSLIVLRRNGESRSRATAP